MTFWTDTIHPPDLAAEPAQQPQQQQQQQPQQQQQQQQQQPPQQQHALQSAVAVVPAVHGAVGGVSRMRANSANRDAEQPAESGGPNRRLACDPCRDRKVRCDRQHPSCGRCARLRHECSYSSPSKQTAAKVDLSRLLLTLHSRLTQAEAQLAQRSAVGDMPFDVPWPDLGISPTTATTATTTTTTGMTSSEPTTSLSSISPITTHNPYSQGFMTMPMEPAADVDMEDILMLDGKAYWSNHSSSNSAPPPGTIAPPISDLSAAQSGPNTAPIFDFNQTSHAPSRAFSSSSSGAGSGPTSAVSSNLISQLHIKFFEVFYPILPMIDQTRFRNEISQYSASIDVLGLSQAMAALGALAAPEFAFAQEQCYNQARELLDMCERQENGGTLANINTLQTCVLLMLYEFKRPNFARSWMTLGRAIRLCKMMGLDYLDADPGCRIGMRPLGLQIDLPPPTSAAEVEERRRTFWILYVFDASAAIRSKTATAFDAMQIPVRLPTPGDISQIRENSVMPSLQHIEGMSPGPLLCPFAGVVLTVSLYRRCFEHVQLSQQPPASSYPFWVTHYRLDRAITDCYTRIPRDPTTALALTLQTNLAAIELWLHETALAKSETETHLPVALRTEAATRCAAAAAGVLVGVQHGQQLIGPERDSHWQSSDFFIWPITMGIEAFRMLGRGAYGIGTGAGTPSSAGYREEIQILIDAMRELVPPELIPVGVLDEPDYRSSDAEAARLDKEKSLRRSNSF